MQVANAALPSLTAVIDVAVAIKCFGVATSYLIVVGDLMPEVITTYPITTVSMYHHSLGTVISPMGPGIGEGLVNAVPCDVCTINAVLQHTQNHWVTDCAKGTLCDENQQHKNPLSEAQHPVGTSLTHTSGVKRPYLYRWLC